MGFLCDNEQRFPTGNPNVTMVQRANNNTLETLRETRVSSGEIPDPDDASVTVETITINRKSLTQQS